MKKTYQKPVLEIETVNVISMLAASEPKIGIGDGEVDPGELDAKADKGWDDIWED